MVVLDGGAAAADERPLLDEGPDGALHPQRVVGRRDAPRRVRHRDDLGRLGVAGRDEELVRALKNVSISCKIHHHLSTYFELTFWLMFLPKSVT